MRGPAESFAVVLLWRPKDDPFRDGAALHGDVCSPEMPDRPSQKFNNQTPVTHALATADRESLDWVIAVRGGNVRLYSTETSGAAGQRGRAETFIELNLPVLSDDDAGYVPLVFAADAPAPGRVTDPMRKWKVLASATLGLAGLAVLLAWRGPRLPRFG